MSDHDRRAPTRRVLKGLLNELLRDVVQVGRGFVENQDLRITNDGARDGDTLPLATGHHYTAFTHHGVQTCGERGDEFLEVGICTARFSDPLSAVSQP